MLHRLPTFLLLCCGVVFAVAPTLPAQSGDQKVQVNLDPLMAFPGLWEKTPDTLESMFAQAGFERSPSFRWMGKKEGMKDVAVFDKKPFTNVSAAVSIFGGKVPVESGAVYFAGGKAVRLVVTLTVPGGSVGQQPSEIEQAHAAAEAALGTAFASASVPQARLRGFKEEKGLKTQVWRSANAVGVLDYSMEKKVLRISIAPPSTDPMLLAGYPIRELVADDPQFFLNLDPLLSLPALWSLTPERVESIFAVPGGQESPYYQWLTTDKSGVRFSRRPFSNVEIDLSVFDGSVPVDEAVIEFSKGKATKVTVSLYNRGDSGQVAPGEFDRRYKTAGVAVGKWLGVRPTERRPGAQSAVKIGGWAWNA
ncbi:MAG: hypothetical protein ACAH88_15300, partial [Roseimicrobium sp.]